MSDRGTDVECGEHGHAAATFVCVHLASSREDTPLGFHTSTEDETDPWPDAWCDECERRSGGGAWTDESMAFADIKLVCSRCYENIRVAHRTLRETAEYLDYAARAVDELHPLQRKANREFRLGEHPRWDWSQDTGHFVFSREGVPVVTSPFVFVGSFSSSSRTWLWAWNNDSFAEPLRAPIEKVRSLGERRGWEPLSTPMVRAIEPDGWRMSAIAAKVLGAGAAYRCPTERGAVFVLLLQLRWVS